MTAGSVVCKNCKLIFALVPFAAMLLFAQIAPVSAQAIDEELLKKLQQERSIQPGSRQSPVDTARQGISPPQRTLRPPTPEFEIEPVHEPSPLEEDYQKRLGQSPQLKKRAIITERGDIVTIEEEEFDGIEQYGYDMFLEPDVSTVGGVGRVSEDYILGVGDQIVVTMVGAKSGAFISLIDREGRFVIPELPPIPAAGLSLGNFRQLVEKSASETIVGTDIFVSVGSVRQIVVYVMGEVEKPGLYNLTAMSSVFEALNAAGGVKKSGSLRNLSLVQGGTTTKIDLYKFIMGRGSADIKISDGAQISVPAIGPNFAVTGGVIRSAIYEFPPEAEARTIGELIELAGGMIRPRGNRIILNRIEESGKMTISAVEDLSARAWDGDILEITPKSNYQAGKVKLLGHVSVEGTRSLISHATISSLIKSEADLGPTPYLNFAILVTTDPANLSKILKAVNLGLTMRGEQDVPLKDNDELYVFSEGHIRFLSSSHVRNVVLEGIVTQEGCYALDYLAEKAGQIEGQRFDVLRRTFFTTTKVRKEEPRESREPREPGERVRPSEIEPEFDPRSPIELGPILAGPKETDCPEIFRNKPEYLVFALEHSLGISGGVRSPGLYPVADQVSVGSLLASSGGPLPNADLNNIEITHQRTGLGSGLVTAARTVVNLNVERSKELAVASGSTIRVHTLPLEQEPGGVLLTGEFERPGLYSIQKGETLLELIGRAGGLTDQAFPYGAVVTRLSVKLEQEEGFRRAAREINAALASAAVKSDLSAEAATTVRDLATELKTIEAPGRFVVEADPAALRARPELNILMEAGDRVHMPKRPQFVVVSGSVLNPGALQFTAGKDVKQFLKEAGGLTKTADDDRVFLIYPNGVAKPVRTALWSFKSPAVPPGSTIVVPMNLATFTTLDIIRDVTIIFSQLALAAASLAVVADRR